MKNLTLIISIIVFNLFLSINLFSQSCLPEGIEFLNQEQIDNFQSDYPNCTEISGNVKIGVSIGSSDITNLDGLSVLTSFGGNVTLRKNNSLISLSGLSNVTSISGLLWIEINNNITALSGLDNLTYVGGNLWIKQNASLQNLTALSNLTSINGTGLNIGSNASLTDISGLENLDPASISYLNISFNYLLSDCAVQSICDYLASPTAFVEIFSNAPGCNNLQELMNACFSFVDETNKNPIFRISPNPVSSFTNIMFLIEEPGLVTCEIFDITGAKIKTLIKEEKSYGVFEMEIDLSDIQAGVYFCVLTTSYGIKTKRIIKR